MSKKIRFPEEGKKKPSQFAEAVNKKEDEESPFEKFLTDHLERELEKNTNTNSNRDS